jgi:hypothetical protein
MLALAHHRFSITLRQHGKSDRSYESAVGRERAGL